MYAPSNTFITIGLFTQKIEKRPLLSCIAAVLLSLLINSSAIAQDYTASTNPLKKTLSRKIQYDISTYASRGYDDEAIFLDVINNNLYNKRMYSKSTHACVGLNGFINIKNEFGANLAIGYTRERIAEDRGLIGSNGVYSNWLNTDIKLSLLGFSVGVCYDVFLSGVVKNNDSFSYEGFNERCFNKNSTCIYVALSMRLSRLIIETRYGFYEKPHYNANEIAYYNFVNTSVSSSYYEIRAYYRFYTSGNRKKTPFSILSALIN